MRAAKKLEVAEKAREKTEAALAEINSKLADLLDDHNAAVFFQPGDGWCVVFLGDHNAPVESMDLDELLAMNRDQALEYLLQHSI